jgi:hypothetical protein
MPTTPTPTTIIRNIANDAVGRVAGPLSFGKPITSSAIPESAYARAN